MIPLPPEEVDSREDLSMDHFIRMKLRIFPYHEQSNNDLHAKIRITQISYRVLDNALISHSVQIARE